MKTFHPELLEAVYYREKSQISDLKFHKTYVCEEEKHSKPCQKPYATARVAPDLLKALAILSDTTMRRSAVDREDIKPSRN